MSGNEVAIQQALMRADAALAAVEGIAARVSVLEGIWRAVAPQAAQTAQAQAAPQALAPASAAPGAPMVPVPPQPSGLAAVIGPWAGLLQSVLEAAAADVVPSLRTLVAQGQGPRGIVQPPPQPPPVMPQGRLPGQPLPQQPRPEGPAVKPVTAGELDWLREEAAQTGDAVPPVVPAQQTTQLPPGYQHPPGVVPTVAPFAAAPAAAPSGAPLLVPMPR